MLESVKVINSISDAIVLAFSNYKNTEPQLVANLAYYLPNKFNNEVSPILQKDGVSATCGSVFVHYTPQVTSELFPFKPRSVEIGDLLLLVNVKHCGIIKNKAILFQAKKQSFLVSTIMSSPRKDNQYFLYSGWPEFEYTQPAPLTGQKRKVEGSYHELHSGSRYLFIDDDDIKARTLSLESRCPSHSTLTQRIFAPISAAATSHGTEMIRCFACEVYHFIFGGAGREYSVPPLSGDVGWSKVIEDLKKEISTRSSTYLKMDPSCSRGQGDILFLSGHRMSFIDDDIDIKTSESQVVPKLPDILKEYEPPRRGISVIEFTVENNRTSEPVAEWGETA